MQSSQDPSPYQGWGWHDMVLVTDMLTVAANTVTPAAAVAITATSLLLQMLPLFCYYHQSVTKLTFIESLPCSRRRAKHGTYILSFHLCEDIKKQLRLREVSYLLQATS